MDPLVDSGGKGHLRQTYSEEAVLCRIIVSVWRQIAGKPAPWPQTGSHIRRRQDKIDRIIRTFWPRVTSFCFQKSLACQKLESKEEVIAVMETHFQYLKKAYFSDGLKKLENRFVKCIKLK